MGSVAENPGEFWFDPPDSLQEALKVAPNPRDLLARLIRATSQSDVHSVENANGELGFTVHPIHGDGPFDLSLTANNDLKGTSVELIEKVYSVVVAIETKLSSAMYLPSDLRRQRIDAVCKQLHVSNNEFNGIVRNWTKF